MNDKDKIAAIAMALADYEAENAHDVESYVITIQTPAYTPWNAKHLTMRRLPRK